MLKCLELLRIRIVVSIRVICGMSVVARSQTVARCTADYSYIMPAFHCICLVASGLTVSFPFVFEFCNGARSLVCLIIATGNHISLLSS